MQTPGQASPPPLDTPRSQRAVAFGPGRSSGSAPQNTSVIGRAAEEFLTTAPSVLLASFLVNLLALALPLTMLQIYDRVLPNAAIDTMVGLLVGLIVVVAVDVVLKILRDTLITHTAVEQAFQMRVGAVARLLHTDLHTVRGKPGRYWLDRMMAVEAVASVRGNADKALFIDLPFVGIFLLMTGVVGGWLVAVPILLIAVFVIFMLRMTGRQRVLMEERREEDEKRYTQITEWLSGVTTIKLLAMESQIFRRFEAMLTRAAGYSYHAVLQNNRLPVLGQLFSNLMMVAVSTAGAMFVIDGSMSIGSLACCSLLATRVAQPVFRVVTIAAHIRTSALTEARANAISELPVSLAAAKASPCRGAIKLLQVCVPPQGAWSGFECIDLAIEPGEIIGLTGLVQSGKGALLSLIDGTLAPASGRAMIDDVDVSSADMPTLRRCVQRIDGRVAIFRGTILENVAMFRGGAYVAESVAAIAAIGLDGVINKLPEGYDTRIGDGAPTVLPYGFQQSLMIARALAQRPAILLVAQIGGLLHIDNFRRLERALRDMPSRPTTIFASQRGSAFTVAQRVYEIREGSLYPLGEVPAQSASVPSEAARGLALTAHAPDRKIA